MTSLLHINSQRGSVPIISAIVLSAVIYVAGKNSMDKSLGEFKNSEDRRISEDLAGMLASGFKKIDQYVGQEIVDTEVDGVCDKSTKLKFTEKAKKIGLAKSSIFNESQQAFYAELCKVQSFKDSQWGSIFNLKRAAACDVFKNKILVENKNCSLDRNFLILKSESNAKSALGYPKDKEFIKRESIARVYFPHDANLNCAQALKEGKMKAAVTNVVFDSTSGGGKRCKYWGKKGAGIVAGRNTQTREAKLKDNVTVCSIRVTSNTKKFYYDDGFALTMNGRVIATGRMGSKLFKPDPKHKNVRVFDYNKIRGKSYGSTGTEGCGLATNRCSVPKTETVGRFEIDPTKASNASLSRIVEDDRKNAGIDDTRIIFDLTVTGDDDPDIDCKHRGMELQVGYTYFERLK